MPITLVVNTYIITLISFHHIFHPCRSYEDQSPLVSDYSFIIGFHRSLRGVNNKSTFDFGIDVFNYLFGGKLKVVLYPLDKGNCVKTEQLTR